MHRGIVVGITLLVICHGSLAATTSVGAATERPLVDGGQAALDATAVSSESADSNLSSMGRFWLGNDLFFNNGTLQNGGLGSGTYHLRRFDRTNDTVGDFVREFTVDSNGSTVIPTATLAAESYVVTTETGTPIEVVDGVANRTVSSPTDAGFSLTEHILSVSTDATYLTNESGDSTTQLTFDSNRVDYNITITAAGLTQNQLLAMFDRARQHDSGVLIRSESSSKSVDLNVSTIPAGNYTLNFTVTDSTATSTASVTVGVPPDRAYFNATRTLCDGRTYWRGVRLSYTATSATAEYTVVNRSTGRAVLSVNSTADGTVRLDTRTVDVGTYGLENSSGASVVDSFRIKNQSLSLEPVGETSYTRGIGSEATYTVHTNRTGRFSLVVYGDALGRVDGRVVDGNYIVRNVSDGDAISINTTSVVGDRAATFKVADTAATSTVSYHVEPWPATQYGNRTVTLRNESLYWQGQLLTSTNASADSELELYKIEDGNRALAMQLTADGNGSFSIDTTAIYPGTYRLYSQSDELIASFDVVSQDLSASFDNTSVSATDLTGNVTISSTRATFDLVVWSPQATTETLLAAFPNAENRSGHVVIRNVESGSAVQLDLTALPGGTYEVGVSPVDTPAAGSTVVPACRSVPVAVDANNDGRVGDFEILDAIELWRSGDAVPETCGETIGDFQVLDIIEIWRSNDAI